MVLFLVGGMGGLARHLQISGALHLHNGHHSSSKLQLEPVDHGIPGDKKS